MSDGHGARSDARKKLQEAAGATETGAGATNSPDVGAGLDDETLAERLMSHEYSGQCPDALEGWQTRDPECEGCNTLDALIAALRDTRTLGDHTSCVEAYTALLNRAEKAEVRAEACNEQWETEIARADKAEARVAELVNCAPRFWSKVNMDQPCWLWTGSLGDNGYGRFSDGERLVVAHRWSYEMAKGPVPEGLDLDHLCRVRNCVNPDHLEPVTRSENNLRGIAARGTPTHCRRGHEMTPENFYQRPGGYRVCRKCKKAGDLRRRVRKAEERKSNGAL